MIKKLNEAVTDIHVLSQGFILRDGFAFVLGDKPAVYDTLLIRWPADAVGTPKFAKSSRTLEEHIQLINQHKLETARIICRDLSFITQCPTLTKVSIHPDDMGFDDFDYSPLYTMPNLKSVCCITKYGIKEQYKTDIDYAKLRNLREVSMAGLGHINYEKLPFLESLWISNCKKHRDFKEISCSTQLKDVTLMQCALQSLDGIENHSNMRSVALWHNRSLTDISALEKLANTLRVIDIEACPKISDFSFLAMMKNLEHLRLYGSNRLPSLAFLTTMENLEHLRLYGSNRLPSLAFLKEMPNLKTFTFTMDVEDGDLSLCKDIPYASCKNRKHFNIKDAQLPKNLPIRAL